MKKIYLTLGLGVLFLGASAQQLKIKTNTGNKKVVHANWAGRVHSVASTSSLTIDTLLPSSITTGSCAVSGSATSLACYQAYSTPDSGYAFGTSTAQTFTYNTGTVVTVTATTSELAQKYTVGTASVTVTNVLVMPGVGTGSVTTTKAYLYADGPGTPGAILGTSNAVPMSKYVAAVDTDNVYLAYVGLVSYSFTPVAIAAGANFFASVTVPAFGGTDHDTLGIVSTQIGCSSDPTDSLSWMKTKYLIPVGTATQTQNQWAPVKDLFGAAQNVDLMIFPVVDINTSAGINNYVSHGDLSIYAASPNPANTTININFSVAKPATVEVQVFDVTGKMVKSVKNSDVVTGKNAISVDVSNLEAGSYMYSINANGNKMFSKFVVTK